MKHFSKSLIVLVAILLINQFSCQEALIRALSTEANSMKISFPKNYLSLIKNINLSDWNYKVIQFPVSQINERLQNLDSQVKEKFKSIIFANTVVFKGFHLQITYKNGILAEFIGAAKNENGFVDLGYICVTSKGELIQQKTKVTTVEDYRRYCDQSTLGYDCYKPIAFTASQINDVYLALKATNYYHIQEKFLKNSKYQSEKDNVSVDIYIQNYISSGKRNLAQVDKALISGGWRKNDITIDIIEKLCNYIDTYGSDKIYILSNELNVDWKIKEKERVNLEITNYIKKRSIHYVEKILSSGGWRKEELSVNIITKLFSYIDSYDWDQCFRLSKKLRDEWLIEENKYIQKYIDFKISLGRNQYEINKVMSLGGWKKHQLNLDIIKTLIGYVDKLSWDNCEIQSKKLYNEWVSNEKKYVNQYISWYIDRSNGYRRMDHVNKIKSLGNWKDDELTLVIIRELCFYIDTYSWAICEVKSKELKESLSSY